jgi:hypothetical protein
MKTEQLAAALLADRNKTVQERTDIITCFACGYSFVYRGRQGELNGRFCSMRCQDWYDAGNPSYERQRELTKIVYRDRAGRPMKPGRDGFYIRCVGCDTEFESKGLRACSIECERRHNERKNNLAIMAEAGIEPAAKRYCEREGCGAVIPKWRKGRRVSAATRFCSPRCADRARKRAAS